MKTLPALFLLAAVGVSFAGLAEPVVPAALDRNLFAETFSQSPFILETKVEKEPVIEEGPVFTANLYLRGIGKVDGRDFVMLQKVGEERTIKLVGNEVGEDSLVIKSVKIGGNFHETKVILGKGAETGEVGFKEESINTVAATTVRPPATSGRNPMNPLMNSGNQPPNPMFKSATPGTNPGVPRPQFTPTVQSPKPQGNGNMPSFSPGSGSRPDSNRRIRTTVIGQ